MTPACGCGSIGVVGLWHLGTVTAACLARAGYQVTGVDLDDELIKRLEEGRPPVSEPGLSELITRGRADGRLRFSSEPQTLREVDVAWVTFDTPVDDEDHADVEWVLSRTQTVLRGLRPGTLVIVSSQLPVGSTSALETLCNGQQLERDLRFACVPENLRLGQALQSFGEPDRIVAGIRTDEDRRRLASALAPLGWNIEWMGVESAEMTKHALNSFLATSVAFINEVAAICEAVGADATEVARGLKTERRIGPRAYLSPGDAFAGGTLARDVEFLRQLAKLESLPDTLLSGVAVSNSGHKSWARRTLLAMLTPTSSPDRPLARRSIAVWGLTYKPGTNTLRRSSAVELCRWLTRSAARVRAHDPSVTDLPAELDGDLELCDGPLEAAEGADALIISTGWPDYRRVAAEDLLAVMEHPLVIDATGFLRSTLGSDSRIQYVRVGVRPA